MCFLKIIIFCFANKYYSYIQKQKYLQYCYSHNYRKFQNMLILYVSIHLKKIKSEFFVTWCFCFMYYTITRTSLNGVWYYILFYIFFIKRSIILMRYLKYEILFIHFCVLNMIHLMYKIIIIFYIENYNCVGRNVNFYIFVIVFFGKLKIMQIKSNTKNTNFRNPISKAFYI